MSWELIVYLASIIPAYFFMRLVWMEDDKEIRNNAVSVGHILSIPFAMLMPCVNTIASLLAIISFIIYVFRKIKQLNKNMQIGSERNTKIMKKILFIKENK
jgi:hypothetical protein